MTVERAVLSARALALLLGGAGVMHFVATDTFATVIPPGIGSPRRWVQLSGIAELVTSALLIARPTRRIGSRAAVILLVAVFPGNVYVAVKGGYSGLEPPFDGELVGWLRVPLQAPLIWWAWRAGADHS